MQCIPCRPPRCFLWWSGAPTARSGPRLSGHQWINLQLKSRSRFFRCLQAHVRHNKSLMGSHWHTHHRNNYCYLHTNTNFWPSSVLLLLKFNWIMCYLSCRHFHFSTPLVGFEIRHFRFVTPFILYLFPFTSLPYWSNKTEVLYRQTIHRII